MRVKRNSRRSRFMNHSSIHAANAAIHFKKVVAFSATTFLIVKVFIHIIKPREVLIIIDVQAVHFLDQYGYHKRRRVLLREDIGVLAVDVKIEKRRVEFGYQRVKLIIVHIEVERQIDVVAIMHTRVVNGQVPLADDLGRLLVLKIVVVGQLAYLDPFDVTEIGVLSYLFDNLLALPIRPFRLGVEQHAIVV